MARIDWSAGLGTSSGVISPPTEAFDIQHIIARGQQVFGTQVDVPRPGPRINWSGGLQPGADPLGPEIQGIDLEEPERAALRLRAMQAEPDTTPKANMWDNLNAVYQWLKQGTTRMAPTGVEGAAAGLLQMGPAAGASLETTPIGWDLAAQQSPGGRAGRELTQADQIEASQALERVVAPVRRWQQGVAERSEASVLPTVFGGEGSMGYEIARGLSENSPQLGAQILTTLVGGPVPGAVLAFTQEAGQASEDYYQKLRQEGVPEEEARLRARNAGSVYGALAAIPEQLSVGKITAAGSRLAGKRLPYRVAMRTLRALGSGAVEGSTETAQQGIQDLVGYLEHGKFDTTKKEYVLNFVLGALLGTGADAVLEGARGLSRKQRLENLRQVRAGRVPESAGQEAGTTKTGEGAGPTSPSLQPGDDPVVEIFQPGVGRVRMRQSEADALAAEIEAWEQEGMQPAATATATATPEAPLSPQDVEAARQAVDRLVEPQDDLPTFPLPQSRPEARTTITPAGPEARTTMPEAAVVEEKRYRAAVAEVERAGQGSLGIVRRAVAGVTRSDANRMLARMEREGILLPKDASGIRRFNPDSIVSSPTGTTTVAVPTAGTSAAPVVPMAGTPAPATGDRLSPVETPSPTAPVPASVSPAEEFERQATPEDNAVYERVKAHLSEKGTATLKGLVGALNLSQGQARKALNRMEATGQAVRGAKGIYTYHLGAKATPQPGPAAKTETAAAKPARVGEISALPEVRTTTTTGEGAADAPTQKRVTLKRTPKEARKQGFSDMAGGSLWTRIKAMGGIRDEGTEISTLFGGKNQVPQRLINNKNGLSIDDVGRMLWEAGIAPPGGGEVGRNYNPWTHATVLEYLAEHGGKATYTGRHLQKMADQEANPDNYAAERQRDAQAHLARLADTKTPISPEEFIELAQWAKLREGETTQAVAIEDLPEGSEVIIQGDKFTVAGIDPDTEKVKLKDHVELEISPQGTLPVDKVLSVGAGGGGDFDFRDSADMFGRGDAGAQGEMFRNVDRGGNGPAQPRGDLRESPLLKGLAIGDTVRSPQGGWSEVVGFGGERGQWVFLQDGSRINAARERLVRGQGERQGDMFAAVAMTAKTETAAAKPARAKKGRTIKERKAEAMIEALTEAAADPGEVVIAATRFEAAESQNVDLTSLGDGQLHGFYRISKGRTVLILEDIVAGARERGIPVDVFAAMKWTHEIGGHRGLRKLIPDQAKLNALLDAVTASVGAERIGQAIGTGYDNRSARVQAEEYLAHLAERVASGESLTFKERRIWRRVVEAIRQALRDLGRTLRGTSLLQAERLTDVEIARVVREAVRGVRGESRTRPSADLDRGKEGRSRVDVPNTTSSEVGSRSAASNKSIVETEEDVNLRFSLSSAKAKAVEDGEGWTDEERTVLDVVRRAAEIDARFAKAVKDSGKGKRNVKTWNAWLDKNPYERKALKALMRDLGQMQSFASTKGKLKLRGLPIESRHDGEFAFHRNLPQLILDRIPADVFLSIHDKVNRAVEQAFRAGVQMNAGIKFERSMDSVQNESQEWRLQTPIRQADKTVYALNLNSACPTFTVGNRGCWMDACYLTQMARANGTNLFERAMYAGEILQLSEKDAEVIRAMGGVRMNGVGDTTPDNMRQVQTIIRHAAMRNMPLKIISKSEMTLKAVQDAADQGMDVSHVQVQPSVDYWWTPVEADLEFGSSGAREISATMGGMLEKGLESGNADMVEMVYEQFGKPVRKINGKWYRKDGLTWEQLRKWKAKYAKVNIIPRAVVSSTAEVVDVAMHHPDAVITLMHGKLSPEIVSDLGGELYNYGAARHEFLLDDQGNAIVRGDKSSPKSEGVRWPSIVNKGYQALQDAINKLPSSSRKRIIKNLQDQTCCQANDSPDACAGCASHCALRNISNAPGLRRAWPWSYNAKDTPEQRMGIAEESDIRASLAPDAGESWNAAERRWGRSARAQGVQDYQIPPTAAERPVAAGEGPRRPVPVEKSSRAAEARRNLAQAYRELRTASGPDREALLGQIRRYESMLPEEQAEDIRASVGQTEVSPERQLAKILGDTYGQLRRVLKREMSAAEIDAALRQANKKADIEVLVRRIAEIDNEIGPLAKKVIAEDDDVAGAHIERMMFTRTIDGVSEEKEYDVAYEKQKRHIPQFNLYNTVVKRANPFIPLSRAIEIVREMESAGWTVKWVMEHVPANFGLQDGARRYFDAGVTRVEGPWRVIQDQLTMVPEEELLRLKALRSERKQALSSQVDLREQIALDEEAIRAMERAERLRDKVAVRDRDAARYVKLWEGLIEAGQPEEMGKVLDRLFHGSANAFRTRMSEAADPQAIIDDMLGPNSGYWADADHEDRIILHSPDGHITIQNADRKNCYISASEANSSGRGSASGSRLYQVAFTWAHNNDKVIGPDPAGLSRINEMRRTFNMLSSALRHGTTRHMKPHNDQGLHGWGKNYKKNLALMANRIQAIVFDAAPGLRNITFDVSTQQFRDNSGRALSNEKLTEVARETLKARSVGVGRATAKMAVLQSAVQEQTTGLLAGQMGGSTTGEAGLLRVDPAETGEFLASVSSPPSTSQNKTFPGFRNEELERRITAASDPNIGRETLLDKAREAARKFGHHLTRTNPELPGTAEFAPAKDILRRMTHRRAQGTDEAFEAVTYITEPITDREGYRLFARDILLADLEEQANKFPKKPLPFGFTGLAEVQNTRRELAPYINARADVQAALKRRRDYQRDLVRQYLTAAKAIGVDLEHKFGRVDYFRHVVVDYINYAMEGVFDPRLRAPLKRGWLAKRQASKLDIKADYVSVELDVMAQMLADMRLMRLMKEIKDGYDVMEALRKRAAKANVGLAEDDPKRAHPLDFLEEMFPGYVVWQPNEGNQLYMAMGIPERIAIERFKDMVGLKPENLQKIQAVGAPNEQWVIPKTLAQTLNTLQIKEKESIPGRIGNWITKPWKIWQLQSPIRVIKYNLRNASEIDKVLAHNPRAARKFKQAATELWAVMIQGKPMPARMRAWWDLGGIQSLSLMQEGLGTIFREKSFERFAEPKTWAQKALGAPGEANRFYWKWARKMTNLREAVLRYANYLEYLEQMKADPQGRPRNFGGSKAADVMALKRLEDRAFKLSNELLGAYDQLGQFGTELRKSLIPFWSFQETNMRTYWGLMRNAWQNHEVAAMVGRTLLGKAATSPLLAIRIGVLALKAAAFWAACQAFNHWAFGDDEEELPEDVRALPHINLGRNKDGNIRHFTRLGTLSDVLEWVGLDDAPQDLKDLLDGRRTLGEIAAESVAAPVNKLANSISPTIKTPLELLTGRQLYPRAMDGLRFSGRPITDRWEYLMGQVGLNQEYRALVGKPLREGKYLGNWSRFFIYKENPREAAYYAIRDEVYRWKRNNSDEGEERKRALYLYKMALRYKDSEAAERYLKEYAALGGTKKGMRTSLESMHPLAALKDEEQRAFVRSLGEADRARLILAERYWREVVTGKRQDQ